MAKVVSLVVKFGALVFVLKLPATYAIEMQLLGGIWICQMAPAVVGGLFTRWFHPWGLLAGWAAGMVAGTGMVWSLGLEGGRSIPCMWGGRCLRCMRRFRRWS